MVAAPITVPRTFEEIEAAWHYADREWRRLFFEPDCWIIPEKREAMLRARWKYQDAKIAWVCACWKREAFSQGAFCKAGAASSAPTM